MNNKHTNTRTKRRRHTVTEIKSTPQEGHSMVKNTGGGAGSIVWGLGFWLGKYILGFFKNIDLDDS